MDQSACKLTLIYPPASEEQLVELMMNSDPPLPGFTSWRGEGHGHSFSKASLSERVRGRVARGMLVAVVPRCRLAVILEEIRTKAKVSELTYFVEPIEDFGRLERVDTADVEAAQTPA